MASVRLFAVLLTLLMGCNHSSKTAFEPYHFDGRAKPKVAFLPIKSRNTDLNWSLSDEMLSYFEDYLLQTANLYIARLESSYEQYRSLASQDLLNPENNLKRHFAPNEFLIQGEVIAHDFVPADRIEDKIPAALKGNIIGELRMKLRVQVIDIRFSKPRVILHEIIESNELIDPLQTLIDYSKLTIDNSAYKKSPMYHMHRNLAKQVASRLDEYITIAKSRTFE